MPKSVDIDISGVEVFFENIEEGLESIKPLLDEIGHFLQFSILARTGKGIDVEGGNFHTYAPYSKSWKKVREREGLPTDHVDLFFGGSMLSALTYETTKDSVRLFFMNTPHVPKKGRKGKSGLTNPEVAYYNNEVREFFAISLSEEKKILKMAEDYLTRILQKG